MSGQTAAKIPSVMTVEEFLAWDGGGHVGSIGTAALIPAVVDAVKVPRC